MSYKDISFCPAKDCRNLDCRRNMNHPDFQPNGLSVCYVNFYMSCKEYKEQKQKEHKMKKDKPYQEGVMRWFWAFDQNCAADEKVIKEFIEFVNREQEILLSRMTKEELESEMDFRLRTWRGQSVFDPDYKAFKLTESAVKE